MGTIREPRDTRASSVPTKLRTHAFRDTSWRKGDEEITKDPRDRSADFRHWKERVYPKWWGAEDQTFNYGRETHDDLDD